MEKFWELKSLYEMTPAEWESLCDGCGLCCLHKVEDEDTGEYFETSVHCKLFDPKSCRCKSYAKRKKYVSDCQVLTPKKVAQFRWLPKTCAYRLISEGSTLPKWHHLVSGSRNRVHKEGISTRRRSLVCEQTLKKTDELVDYVLDHS
tara:strand:- start:1270 stop:1710 length:441 start_codon:yes stop_codon:yes gene_type:complete